MHNGGPPLQRVAELLIRRSDVALGNTEVQEGVRDDRDLVDSAVEAKVEVVQMVGGLELEVLSLVRPTLRGAHLHFVEK